jgi:hypothetical protein
MSPNSIPPEAFYALGFTAVVLLAIWFDYLVQHNAKARWACRLLTRLMMGRYRF